MLNQLNEMIDNPALYGGLGKNNKTLVMAGALREDLETGIKKALGDENWGKIKVLRSELKSISDLRKGFKYLNSSLNYISKFYNDVVQSREP
jgi:hypothetical protein